MNLTLDNISQIGIMIFGLSAVWLVTSTDRKMRLLGCWCGVLSQPFWFYTVLHNEQWGIAIAAIVYTISWIKGIINNRNKPI